MENLNRVLTITMNETLSRRPTRRVNDEGSCSTMSQYGFVRATRGRIGARHRIALFPRYWRRGMFHPGTVRDFTEVLPVRMVDVRFRRAVRLRFISDDVQHERRERTLAPSSGGDRCASADPH